MQVFGRWKDRFYYPGSISMINESNKVNRYTIAFDDSTSRKVSSSDIVVSAKLKIGDEVMAKKNGGEESEHFNELARIIKKDNKGCFVVQFSDTTQSR